MKSFLLLLVIDIAVVAAALAFFAPRSRPPRSVLDPRAAEEVARLQGEADALRADVERLEAFLDAPAGSRTPATTTKEETSSPRPPSPARSEPMTSDEELDRLEAAIEAVSARKARALARQSLRMGVGAVFPNLTDEQLDSATEAVIAYRETLTQALLPGGAGPERGYDEAVAHMRRVLQGAVPRAKADAIVAYYSVRPGAPAQSPAVSPPVRRR